MFLVYLRIKKKKFVLYCVALLSIFDLFLANYGFYRTARWDWYIVEKGFEDAFPDNLETERYFVTGKTAKDFQLLLLDRITMNSAYAALFRLYTIDGVEIMRVMHHNTFLALMNSTPSISDAKKYFDISSVRHVITSYKVEDRRPKACKEHGCCKKSRNLYEYRSPGRFLLFQRRPTRRTQGGHREAAIRRIRIHAELILLKPHGVNTLSPTPTLSRQGEREKMLTKCRLCQGRGRIVPSAFSRQGRGRTKG